MSSFASQVNQSSNIIFSIKLFHFSFKILNATSKKIMFLWNFCHLFPVLFYDWNTSINDSFRFFRVFFWESFPGSEIHFSMGGFAFQLGDFIFKWGMGEGGGVSHGGGGLKPSSTPPAPCPPYYGNPGCLNVKEVPARKRCDIWTLRDRNEILNHNHLLHKRTLNHFQPVLLKFWAFIYELSDCGWIPLESHKC